MVATVTVRGQDQLNRALARIPGAMAEEIDELIGEEMRAVFARTQVEVPVSKPRPNHVPGRLKRSGRVDREEGTGAGSVAARLGAWFIRYTAPYAVFVEFRTELRHDPPTKARFVSDPLQRATPRIAARVATGLARGILRGGASRLRRLFR